MTEKWGEIQGKLDSVRVSREFVLPEFKLSGFCCSVQMPHPRTTTKLHFPVKYQFLSIDYFKTLWLEFVLHLYQWQRFLNLDAIDYVGKAIL